MFELSPMATPPVTRHRMKAAKFGAHPVRTEERGEENRRGEQHGLASIAVGESSSDERAKETTGQRAAIGPTDRGSAVQVEIDLEELTGASDDDPVVAEEQAAEGGDHRDAPDVDGRRRRLWRVGCAAGWRATHV